MDCDPHSVEFCQYGVPTPDFTCVGRWLIGDDALLYQPRHCFLNRYAFQHCALTHSLYNVIRKFQRDFHNCFRFDDRCLTTSPARPRGLKSSQPAAKPLAYNVSHTFSPTKPHHVHPTCLFERSDRLTRHATAPAWYGRRCAAGGI